MAKQTVPLIKPDLPLYILARDLCKQSYLLPAALTTAVPFLMGDGSMRGYFSSIDEALFCVWTGSHNIFDWLRDARAWPTSEGVHTGVYQTYTNCLTSMLQARQKFPSWMKVRHIGHSLGGALADLAYCSSDANGCLPPILFESMRVFTVKSMKTLPEDGIRFVNELDMVCHLPGKDGIWSYGHRCWAFRTCGHTFEDPRQAHSLDIWDAGFQRELEGPLRLL